MTDTTQNKRHQDPDTRREAREMGYVARTPKTDDAPEEEDST